MLVPVVWSMLTGALLAMWSLRMVPGRGSSRARPALKTSGWVWHRVLGYGSGLRQHLSRADQLGGRCVGAQPAA